MPLSYRMLGTAKAPATIKAHGRTYQGGAGTILTVPYQDGDRLRANGFAFIAFSAPTAARPPIADGPLGARLGTLLWDETLAQLVICDGAAWRDPSTGNIV